MESLPLETKKKLLQYLQLPDKNSANISRYVYFKIVTCLFHYFSRNPRRCSVEPSRFRGTQFNKHSLTRIRHLTLKSSAIILPDIINLLAFIIVIDCILVELDNEVFLYNLDTLSRQSPKESRLELCLMRH